MKVFYRQGKVILEEMALDTIFIRNMTLNFAPSDSDEEDNDEDEEEISEDNFRKDYFITSSTPIRYDHYLIF